MTTPLSSNARTNVVTGRPQPWTPPKQSGWRALPIALRLALQNAETDIDAEAALEDCVRFIQNKIEESENATTPTRSRSPSFRLHVPFDSTNEYE